jgi:hypothetical protein
MSERIDDEIPGTLMNLIRDVADIRRMSDDVVVGLSWMERLTPSPYVKCRHYWLVS